MTALLITSGAGPVECRIAVARIAERLAEEAAARGVALDLALQGDPEAPVSAVAILSGPGAEALADEWRGVALWRCPSPVRPRHKRKNWFVELFDLPRPQGAPRIDPEAVRMQTLRAGGPGGQHQNKTSSAVRARWTAPDGAEYAVLVRDHRSQHRNRKAALERLEALAAQDAAVRARDGKAAARLLHTRLQRGAPARVFEGPAFREARR